MKKRFSLSRLLHNDKLMMLISLLLAILIWALVVFGPSNTQEQVITGVPVSIALNDYAGQTLNLRITNGANATATVTVQGLRSVVSSLSAADLTVTADTGNVIKEGTYTLPIRAVSTGDYSIKNVVGPDGNNATVTISCDVWREAFFSVSVEMPELSVEDETVYQIGTPVVSNEVLDSGLITIEGPRSDINRVDAVVAVINDKQSIRESTVFTADLQARDIDGRVIDTVSFKNAQDAKISVTVPVLVYRSAELMPVILNAPSGYADNQNLVTVTPSNLEIWGVPSEIDDYVSAIQEQLKVDFDQLNPDTLNRVIELLPTDGIRPVNGNETINLKVNLNQITSKAFEVTLNDKNFSVAQAPDGCTVTAKQTKLTVTLCGPPRVLNNIKSDDIRVVVKLPNASTGLQTVHARVDVPSNNTVWAYYDEGLLGAELLVSVDSKTNG